MKNQSEKRKAIKVMVQTMVEKETREWPPTCIGFIYQPQRPRKMVVERDDVKCHVNK